MLSVVIKFIMLNVVASTKGFQDSNYQLFLTYSEKNLINTGTNWA
jgi:hypothetical protein